eukprot:scaffold1348_cov184-Ochromonas_danica.AAC.6
MKVLHCTSCYYLMLLLAVVILSSSSTTATTSTTSSSSSSPSSTVKKSLLRSSSSSSSLPLIKSRTIQQVKRQSLQEVIIAGSSSSNGAVEGKPQSSLVTINCLMFLFYATLGSVMPYIPIFYRYLGVSDMELGLLGAITPAVTFLVSPLWGALADATGKHKQIMLFTFIGSVIARCAMISCKQHMLWLSVVVAVTAALYAPVRPLLDSAVMSMLSDKTAYGRSRLFGQVGFGIGSYLVGPVLTQNLRGIFGVQVLLAIPTALIMSTFDPKPALNSNDDDQSSSNSVENNIGRHRFWKKMNILNHLKFSRPRPVIPPPPMNVWLALRDVFFDWRVMMFFTIVFIIGVSSGIVENFAYIRLAEVGVGRNYGSLVRILGINGVLTVSLLSYVIRFVIYAYIRNPWHAMPAELLRGITFALFWSGATYYVYNISPKSLTATMLGLLNGVYGGLGQSLGSLIGGELSRKMGICRAFYSCAAVDLSILATFLVIQISLHFSHKLSNSRIATKYAESRSSYNSGSASNGNGNGGSAASSRSSSLDESNRRP